MSDSAAGRYSPAPPRPATWARWIAPPLILWLLGAAAAHPATAATYYVSTSGNNDNAGTSLAAPLRTIDYAVNIANPGDSIEVRGGTYTENVVIRRPGSADAWISLRAYADETPLLRSSGVGPTIYVYHADCDEDVIGDGSGNVDCHPMYWEISGLALQGSPNGGGDGNAIKIDAPKVRLIGNRLCCSVADIVKLVRTSNDVQILDNEIWQDASVVTPGGNAQGVDIVGADRVRVTGNDIHDVPDIGVYAKGNARNALFERNRLVNIGAADNGNALMLGQSTDADRLVDGNYESYDGVVRNNVVVGASWACLATSSSFNARFYNNSCYDTGRLSQASILLSNESEIGQAGTQLYFVNNIVYGSAARPVFKIGSDAMADYATLTVARNMYYVSGGAPQFTASDFFGAVGFSEWTTNFQGLTGHADTSFVADPMYDSLVGTTPLMIAGTSPAVNAGADATGIVSDDYLGNLRPAGTAIDIGAYEFGSSDRLFCDDFDDGPGC